MRILEKDKEGITLIPETLNDLWYFYTHLEERIIWQKTLRTKTVCKSGEILKGGKIPCYLGIKIEKIKWEDYKLRVTGTITEGEERNKHHSMDIELNEKAKIIGELENIPRKEKRELLVCIIDRKSAILAWLDGRHACKTESVEAKGRTEEFFKEAANRLKRENPNYLLLASPDASKNKIANLLEKKGGLFLDQTASGGKDGVEEILKRGLLNQIFDKQREDSERKSISEIIARVKKEPQKSCYGLDIEKNFEKVKEIIVLNTSITKYEGILKSAEKSGLIINIIDSSKDYAKELRQFEIIGVCWY